MKNRKAMQKSSGRTEQKALQQFHQKVFRRALQLARQAGRRNVS